MNSELIEKHIDESFGSDLLNEETYKQVELLKIINRLGFVTTNSQAGEITFGELPSNVYEYTKAFETLWE